MNSRIRNWSGLLIGTLILVLMPLAASAETVVRTGGSVSVSANQVVENDFYAAGGSVLHSGEVREDMYVAAGSVTVNGEIGQDLTVLGGTVGIHGRVGDDLRVVGGEVIVASEIKGDVFVFGGQLRLLSTGKVGGNVYFYGGEAEIEGAVSGAVMGRAESFVVNAPTGGVDVIGKLSLGNNAVVGNDVRYDSVEELNRSPAATVEGTVNRVETPMPADERSHTGLIILVVWLFTTLCFFLLLRSRIEQLWHSLKKDTVASGLFGSAALILSPVLAFILFMTVLGAWLGIITLILFVLLMIISLILLPIMIGQFLMSFLTKGNKLDFTAVLVGMIATALLVYLPWIGGFLVFVGLVLTSGTLSLALYRRIRDLI